MSSIIAVMIAVLLIWGGLFSYLMYLDAKVRRLDK